MDLAMDTMEQTNRALKQALEQLEVASNNELSVGYDELSDGYDELSDGYDELSVGYDELSFADDEVSVGGVACPEKDTWKRSWGKSSNARCDEWWENDNWGAGKDCRKCWYNAKMAENCPRKCCEQCKSSCKCDQSSTCTTDKEKNFCYLAGGMMGKYCKYAKRSKKHKKRYLSWEPCPNQPCTRTEKYGDFTCEKDGFIYLTGDLAAMHCPGAVVDPTMADTYISYEMCEKSKCMCTREYDHIKKLRCATDEKCFLDGGLAGRRCAGAEKHPRGDFYYSAEVCKYQGATKVIGAWSLEKTITRPLSSTKEYTVKITQKSSRSKEVSDEALNGWANQLSKSNSVEVAVEVGADFGFVSGSLSSKYAHTSDTTRSSNFQQTVKDLATEAFETTVEETVTVKLEPKTDPSEPSHANVWVWKVQAISQNQGEGLFSAIRSNLHWTLETHGCANDLPPNCIPGYCQSHDANCWECTQSWAKIDPDFKYPAYCNGDCWWEPVEDCPSNRESFSLPGCTEQMKSGELCKANVRFLPNGKDAFIHNCSGRYSIYKYKCADDSTAQSLP